MVVSGGRGDDVSYILCEGRGGQGRTGTGGGQLSVCTGAACHPSHNV